MVAKKHPKRHPQKRRRSIFASVRSDSGATLLEFVFVAPLLMIGFVAYLDMMRVFAINGVLQYATEQGLYAAMTTPNLDVNLHFLSPPQIFFIVIR